MCHKAPRKWVHPHSHLLTIMCRVLTAERIFDDPYTSTSIAKLIVLCDIGVEDDRPAGNTTPSVVTLQNTRHEKHCTNLLLEIRPTLHYCGKTECIKAPLKTAWCCVDAFTDKQNKTMKSSCGCSAVNVLSSETVGFTESVACLCWLWHTQL